MSRLHYVLILFLILLITLNGCGTSSSPSPTSPGETLTLGAWVTGNVTPNKSINYYCPATIGKRYQIRWIDRYNGDHGEYTGSVLMSVYRQDFTTPYFVLGNDKYDSIIKDKIITAQDRIINIKVSGYDSTTGNYALKITENSSGGPVMFVEHGTVYIPYGGCFDMGNTPLGSINCVHLDIENNGDGDLRLISPEIRITGAGFAHERNIYRDDPYYCTNIRFYFYPTDLGTKTATVSIYNNSRRSPYVFLIKTTVNPMAEIPYNTWVDGFLGSFDYRGWQTYYFKATIGKTYGINWTGEIAATIYRKDLQTSYLNRSPVPVQINAQDDIVYIKIQEYSYTQPPIRSYKLNVSEATPEPVIGSTDIDEYGTYRVWRIGSRVKVGSSSDFYLRITNFGTADLQLTDNPAVQISGNDVSQFSIITQPFSPLKPSGSSSVMIRFAPTSLGLKTATLSIPNNDPDKNPYIITITGTGI